MDSDIEWANATALADSGRGSFWGIAGSSLEEAGQGVDFVLWLVTRLFAVILILVAVLGCVAAILLRSRLAPEIGHGPSSRVRLHHVKELLYNYVCCGACCACCDRCCRPHVGQLLRVTLVCATKVRQKLDFYLEVRCEPAEGHPKGSRVHRQANGSVDLGYERLELDWFGDEREFVMQVVQYSGSNQSRDVPLGELRISRESVERYAKEAASAPAGETQRGSRMFSVRRLEKAEATKKNRFKNILLPDGVLPAVFAKLGEEQGIELPQIQDLKRLREENEALLQENTQLRMQTSATSCGSWGSWRPQRAVADMILMSVALKFEILPRQQTPFAAPELIHAPSQEDLLPSKTRRGLGGG